MFSNYWRELLISSPVDASPLARNGDYWGDGRGFFPNKDSRHCIHSSLSPLCHALVASPGNDEVLREASMHVNASSILASDEATIEDAHHILAIAQCRMGVNQNPNAEVGKPPIRIPQELGESFLDISAQLGREPSIGYAGLVLDNCVEQQVGDDTSIEHWHIQRTITSESDGKAHEAEKGFYAAHCAVEKAFAPVKKALQNASTNAQLDRPKEMKANLEAAAFALRRMIPTLKAMRNFIDPAHFLPELRRFLKCGLAYENGIMFEGTGTFKVPVPRGTRVINFGTVYKYDSGLRGPTGAMTSTLAFVDAALGIKSSLNADVSLNQTMDDFKQFQPRSHVKVIDLVQQQDWIRQRVLQYNRTSSSDRNHEAHVATLHAYDDVVSAAAEFRLAHVDHISTYILNMIPSSVPITEITGTGGTPISSYLCRSAVGTLDARVRPLQAVSVALPTLCDIQCRLDMKRNLVAETSYCKHIPDLSRRMGLPEFEHPDLEMLPTHL
jgi:hypothetical protein